MIIISSREFRDNQATYLDKIDAGEEVLVQRGKNKAYKITAISEQDTVIDKKFIISANEDLKNAISGDELLQRIKPRIEKLFDK